MKATRINKVQKVYQLCKEYKNSLLAVENYKMYLTMEKGSNQNEFVEHLDKLRTEEIKKKRELKEAITNLD